jgi:hypothetical protein
VAYLDTAFRKIATVRHGRRADMEEKLTRTLLGSMSLHPLVLLSASEYSAQALFLDLVLILASVDVEDGISLRRSSNNIDTNFKIMFSCIIGRNIYLTELVCEDKRILVLLASASFDMSRSEYFEQCRRVLNTVLNRFAQTFGIEPDLILDPDGTYHPSESMFRASLEFASHAAARRNQETE